MKKMMMGGLAIEACMGEGTDCAGDLQTREPRARTTTNYYYLPLACLLRIVVQFARITTTRANASARRVQERGWLETHAGKQASR